MNQAPPSDAPHARVSASTAPGSVEPEHAAFDATVLGDMFGNEPALIASVLHTFATGTAAALADLRRAMAAQDLTEVRALAHKITGASRLSGASALGHLAHDLELAAKQGELGSANEALKKLDAQWPITHAAIGKIRSE